MAPTLCHRCGDAVEDGCDPWEELAELDALLERLRLKRYDLRRKINRFHSPIVRQLPPDVPFSSSAYQILRIISFHLTPERTSLSPYLLEPFAVIGERLLGQHLASGLRWWFVFRAFFKISHI